MNAEEGKIFLFPNRQNKRLIVDILIGLCRQLFRIAYIFGERGIRR